MARKHPAYLYTYPTHARRAVLDEDLALRATEALSGYPAYGALTVRRHKAFWAELGRALQRYDADTVAGTCAILAEALAAKRVTAGSAARLVRDWRLGRLEDAPNGHPLAGPART